MQQVLTAFVEIENVLVQMDISVWICKSENYISFNTDFFV